MIFLKPSNLHFQSLEYENEQQFIFFALKLLKDVRDYDVF